MKKYVSPITAGLTMDNWESRINLSDMSLDSLIDLLGDLKAMEALGKKVGGFLREAVGGKMPEDEIEYYGTHFSIVLNECSRAGGLDKDKITEEMGVDWVEEHSKPLIEYTELRIKPRVEEDV